MGFTRIIPTAIIVVTELSTEVIPRTNLTHLKYCQTTGYSKIISLIKETTDVKRFFVEQSRCRSSANLLTGTRDVKHFCKWSMARHGQYTKRSEYFGASVERVLWRLFFKDFVFSPEKETAHLYGCFLLLHGLPKKIVFGFSDFRDYPAIE